MVEDFSDKKWKVFQDSNISKGKWRAHKGKVAVVSAVGLAALIGSYAVSPTVKGHVDAIGRAVAFVGNYARINSSGYEPFIVKPGDTITGYGKSRGLDGSDLNDWVRAVKNYNLAVGRYNPEIGIDKDGKIYAGKIIHLPKP